MTCHSVELAVELLVTSRYEVHYLSSAGDVKRVVGWERGGASVHCNNSRHGARPEYCACMVGRCYTLAYKTLTFFAAASSDLLLYVMTIISC